MECGSSASLSVMPNEILLKIISFAPSAAHIPLAIVNKRMTSLMEYYDISCILKKIRLVADNLRVLLVAPCSEHDEVDVVIEPQVVKQIPRVHMMSLALSTNESAENHASLKKYETWYMEYLGKTIHFDGKKRGDKQPKISVITATGIKWHRKMLWMKAYSSDLCVLVVDPDEIDAEKDDIKIIALGTYLMMGPGNIIIAVNMSKHVQNSNPQKVFNAAKLKVLTIIKSLRRRVRAMPVQIIPVDVVKGTNIIEREDAKFPWFEGRPLATIMHNDQERTHFDEEQYRKLADQPFEFEPYAVSTYNGSKILEGRVVRGTVTKGDLIYCYQIKAKILHMQRAATDITQAAPGDRIALQLLGVTATDLKQYGSAPWFKEDTMSVTHAFRAEISIFEEDLFTMNQTYTVFYGPLRVRCIVYWMWNNTPDYESPYSIDRKCRVPRTKPKKPTIHPKDIISHRPALKRERRAADAAWYEKACETELEEFLLRCKEHQMHFKRPPKPKLSKIASVILIPIDKAQIEQLKSSAFEKHPGRIMITAAHKIVAVGRVDRVMNLSENEVKKQNPDYVHYYFNGLYNHRKLLIVPHLHTLFWPNEQKQLNLCLEKLCSNL